MSNTESAVFTRDRMMFSKPQVFQTYRGISSGFREFDSVANDHDINLHKKLMNGAAYLDFLPDGRVTSKTVFVRSNANTQAKSSAQSPYGNMDNQSFQLSRLQCLSRGDFGGYNSSHSVFNAVTSSYGGNEKHMFEKVPYMYNLDLNRSTARPNLLELKVPALDSIKYDGLDMLSAVAGDLAIGQYDSLPNFKDKSPKVCHLETAGDLNDNSSDSATISYSTISTANSVDSEVDMTKGQNTAVPDIILKPLANRNTLSFRSMHEAMTSTQTNTSKSNSASSMFPFSESDISKSDANSLQSSARISAAPYSLDTTAIHPAPYEMSSESNKRQKLDHIAATGVEERVKVHYISELQRTMYPPSYASFTDPNTAFHPGTQEKRKSTKSSPLPYIIQSVATPSMSSKPLKAVKQMQVDSLKTNKIIGDIIPELNMKTMKSDILIKLELVLLLLKEKKSRTGLRSAS